MTDPFVAEIRAFPFNFAPKGWALCNGQLMPLSQNTALFSLLGTMYGGDGKSTFALPNLMGRAVLGAGIGPGLTPRSVGDGGGAASVVLLHGQIPAHRHDVAVAHVPGELRMAGSGRALAGSSAMPAYASQGHPVVPLAAEAVAPVGQGLPHNNMQPYTVFNFCIALQGIYPQRS